MRGITGSWNCQDLRAGADRTGSRVAALTLAVLLLAAASASARVLIVTQRHVAYTHYTTIQAAVGAAHAGDWILIDRGVYFGPVRIRRRVCTCGGQHPQRLILDGVTSRHGIVVTANGVWVENLTVRQQLRSAGARGLKDGNEIRWGGHRTKGTRSTFTAGGGST